jgi:hypothetical protein
MPPRARTLGLGLLLLVGLVSGVQADTIGLWGRAVPTADNNHPNLFWNLSEIVQLRQMVNNNNPAALRTLYDTYMRGVVAVPLIMDGAGSDQTDWYAAISYMIEPTTAKASAIRTAMLNFIAANPGGPGNWYSQQCLCGYIMALWYDLVQGLDPSTFSGTERTQIKNWFKTASRSLITDSNNPCAGTVNGSCPPDTVPADEVHQGKALNSLVNWYVRYMGPSLAMAFMGGDQSDVDFWIDSGWPHTLFTYSGVTGSFPPDTQNRWEVMLYLLAVHADGANFESYSREGYNDLANPKTWNCINYVAPDPRDGCSYHFAVMKDPILGALMGWHNGMNNAVMISDIAGDPAMLRTFKKAIATRFETDTNTATLTGHPILWKDPILHVAARMYPNDPTVTANKPNVWTSGDTFPSGAPSNEHPPAVWPFLGAPALAAVTSESSSPLEGVSNQPLATLTRRSPEHGLARGLLGWWEVLPQVAGGGSWFPLVGPYRVDLLNMGAGSGWVSSGSPAPWTGALKFDAVDDYLTFGNYPQWDFVNTTFTVHLSFQAMTDTGSSSYVFERRGGGGGGYFIRVETATSNSAVTARIVDSAGVPTLQVGTVATALYDGKPHSITVVLTTATATAAGNAIQIFVDGVQPAVDPGLAQSGANGYSACGSCNLLIGTRNDLAPGIWSNMSLRGVRLYTRGLSAAEILELAQQTPPTFGGMLSEEPMILGTVTPAAPRVRRKVTIQ